MHMNDHMEAFDKEVSFGIIFNEISKYCPELRFGIGVWILRMCASCFPSGSDTDAGHGIGGDEAIIR